MKVVKIIFSIILFVCLCSPFVKGQTYGVYLTTSNLNPLPGTTVTYTVNWRVSTPSLVTSNWNFTLNGSTVFPLTQSQTQATISWPSTGTGTVNFSAVTGPSNGNGYPSYSGYSDQLTVTVAIPPPSAPLISPATLISGSCFIANWQASTAAVSYRLDLSSDNFSTFVNGIHDAPINGTSISVGGLGVGTYQYRVRAVNSVGGVSANSDVFSFIVVCAGATSTPPSRFINYDTPAGNSDSYCSSGTGVEASIVSTDLSVGTVQGYRYSDLYSSPSYQPYNTQPAVVEVTWNPLKTGYIRVKVDQIIRQKLTCFLCFDCHDIRSTLYYYNIYLANCSSCADSGGPITSNIYQSNDYGCGTQFRLFANFGDKNCQPTSYAWDFGDGQTSTAGNPFHAYQNPGTYNVTLKYKSQCSGSVIVTETTVTRPVTVTSVLSSKLDFNFQNATCGTIFTPLPKYPDSNCSDVAYEWDFGDGTPKSTLASPSHLYSTAGSYDVSLKLTYLCSGCQKFITYQKKVTVPEQPPIASFTRQYNSCTTTFQPVFNLGVCEKTYLWDFGDGTTSTEENPSHTYPSAGTYSTSLTLGYQCSSINCNGQVVITKPTIIAAPVAPAIDFAFENYKCETNFTSSVTQNSTSCSTVSYQWDFGDGTFSSDSNPSHLYANAGAYNVTLTVAYQCGNTCPSQTVTSVSKTVTHSAPPTATADFSITNYYCATAFSPTYSYSSNTCRSVSYNWDFGDGVTSTDRSPLHGYANPGTYNVLFKLLYQCDNGCPSEIVVTKQITFTPTPAAFDNLLVTAETDVKYQVINASAATFSDSWSLSHDLIRLNNKSSFLNGTQGVWRNNASYVYKVPRQLSTNTNLSKDGTFTMNQFDWSSAALNIVPDWIQANTMTEYSPYSYELENRDVLGVYSAALYDYGGHLPSANGVNMRNKEMAFTSFESALDGKPTGNWMLGTSFTPTAFSYMVPAARGHAVVVQASLEQLDLVQRVDVNAETFRWPFFFPYFSSFMKQTAYLQDVQVLCKEVHPTNPDWSILVLSRAPFEGFWFGEITVKNVVSPVTYAVVDGTKAHSGKSSLLVAVETTFRQEMLDLQQGKAYWLNAWVSVGTASLPSPKLADNLGIDITFKDKQGQVAGTASFQPVGTIIEGWQQVKGTFVCPIKNPLIEIKFKSGSAGTAWYDDLRLQPEAGNMKAYVYNLKDYRLQAILDEENYASFFYYDAEGNLYLTKKETERGIKTITENVSYQIER